LSVRYLVGVDDTDNLESRGTGHRARQLGMQLADGGIALLGVTRHQLLVHPAIPYTSHNSAACLEVSVEGEDGVRLIAVCRAFLREESAPGSDAGLCVAAADSVPSDVVEFGRRAKSTVVHVSDADRIAVTHQVYLEPLTGTGIGVIGALAAVGLRTAADDGRFLWLPRLRELTGVHSARDLREWLSIDAVETETGTAAADSDRVAVGDWPRPLLRGGRKLFLVEEAPNDDYRWSALGKERLKRLSD
jgi:hypothetical protein